MLRIVSGRSLRLYFFHDCVIAEWVGVIVDDGNIFADQFLDIGEILFFLGVAEGNCDSFRTSATGTTDTMHIGFGDIGKLEVHDVREFIDIDASSGNIGGDEDASGFRLKI